MTRITAVLFDLGRVLVNLDFSRGLLARLIQAEGEEQADLLVEKLRAHHLFIDYNCGRLSPDQFRAAVCEETGLFLSKQEFETLWCDIFSMDDEMADLLEEVMARVPTGILSDTDPLHWTFVRKTYPVLQRITATTVSYELGVMKPDPRTYLTAARRLGVSPDACFFTDDMPRNIAGARSAGMDARQFIDAPTLRKDLRERGIL